MSSLQMVELSDRQAVERARRGDEGSQRAFKAIYDRYARVIFGFVRRLLPERQLAEDAVQETFVRLFRNLDRVDTARPLKPYLFKIAHNVVLTQLRREKQKERSERLVNDAVSPSDDVVEDISRRERSVAIQRALLKLAPEHRSVLVLRYFHELKLTELADVLECTERTARNRLRAAGVLLERELRHQGIVPGTEF